MGEYNWDPVEQRFKSDREIELERRYGRKKKDGEKKDGEIPADSIESVLPKPTLFAKIRKNRDVDRWPISIVCSIVAAVTAFFGPIGLIISIILTIFIITKLIYDLLFIATWILIIGFIGGGIIVAFKGGPYGLIIGGVMVLIGFGISKSIKHF